MKEFNSDHEAIIDYDFRHLQTGKDGDTVPHIIQVNYVTFFTDNGDGTFRKVYLDKQMLFDLYAQIKEMESRVPVGRQFFSIPF
jgi:hypothetical protein